MNRPALKRLAAHLLANADRHDQQEWALSRRDPDDHPCGTIHCAAGWAVALEGGDYRIDWTQQVDRIDGDVTGYNAHQAYDPRSQSWRPIDQIARELLGLTYGEADRLFWSYGTTDETVAIIKDLLNEDRPRQVAA